MLLMNPIKRWLCFSAELLASSTKKGTGKAEERRERQMVSRNDIVHVKDVAPRTKEGKKKVVSAKPRDKSKFLLLSLKGGVLAKILFFQTSIRLRCANEMVRRNDQAVYDG